MDRRKILIIYKSSLLISLMFGCIFMSIAQKTMNEVPQPKTNYDEKEMGKLKAAHNFKLPEIGCKKNASASFDKVDSGSLAEAIQNMKVQRQLKCFSPLVLDYRKKYQIGEDRYYSKEYLNEDRYESSGPVPMAMYLTVGTNFAKGVYTNIGYLGKFYRKWDLMYSAEVNYGYTSASALDASNINFSRVGVDLGIGYAADFIEKKYIWGLGTLVGAGLNKEFFHGASRNSIVLGNSKTPVTQLKYNVFISGFSYLYLSDRWGLFFKTTLHIFPNSSFGIAEQNMTIGTMMRVVSWRNYWKKYN